MLSAMEECLDYGSPIIYQREDAWSSDRPRPDHRIHRQWHEQTAKAAVASIPIMKEEKCVAVLSLRHAANQNFTADQPEKLAELT